MEQASNTTISQGMPGAVPGAVPQAAIDEYIAGTELAQKKQYKEAAPHFIKAIDIHRFYPEAMMNVGVCFLYMHKLEAAEASLNMARLFDQEWPELEFNMGLVLLSKGNFAAAEAQFEKALALRPDYRDARLNMGITYWHRGHNDDAMALFRQLILDYPEYPEAYINLGGLSLDMQNKAYGIEMLLVGMELAEGAALAALPLAEAYNQIGRTEDAIKVLEKSLEKDSKERDVHRFYIQLLIKSLHFEKAQKAIDVASEIHPDEPAYRILQGSWYQEQSQIEDMAKVFLEVGKNEEVSLGTYSSMLFGLNYADTSFDRDISEIYKVFGRRSHEQWDGARFFYHGDRNPEKPLRIGYISGDYRAHSVSYFVESLFRHHDRSRYMPVVLQESAATDHRTTYLRSITEEWHEVWRLADQALATKVVELDLDILVDLSGHTSSHRLSVFALRAAPVQVTWLGYPNTTGIQDMDYRIVDRWTDPDGQGDDLYSEKLYRLDRCFLCYSPPEMTPEAQPRLSVAGGTVIFGSFNNPAKINHNVLALWARILKEVPNSRLFIKGRQMATPDGRDRYFKIFQDLGAPIDRIDLVGQMSSTFDHLTIYNEIDVALDCFPYNGTTTTCEAMMMGVPVITLSGDAHRHRVGETLLRAVGLPDLVAQTQDEYIAIARNLASDPARLVALRHSLRQTLLESPLCDGADFTRALEGAYRQMWHDFATSQRFQS